MNRRPRTKVRTMLIAAGCLAGTAIAVPAPADATPVRDRAAARPSLLPRHSSGRVTIVVPEGLFDRPDPDKKRVRHPPRGDATQGEAE